MAKRNRTGNSRRRKSARDDRTMMRPSYGFQSSELQARLSEEDELLRRSASQMLAEFDQGILALFGQWGDGVPKHHPKEIVDHLANGTYADLPTTAEERERHEQLLAKMTTALGEGDQESWYPNYRLEIYFFRKYYNLTEAELARLLHVDEPIYESGDEEGFEQMVMEFSADTVFRLIQISAATEQVSLCFGEQGSNRWLREPEEHPAFSGLVPFEELAQDDTVRLDQFRACVEYVYAPAVDRYNEDFESAQGLRDFGYAQIEEEERRRYCGDLDDEDDDDDGGDDDRL